MKDSLFLPLRIAVTFLLYTLILFSAVLLFFTVIEYSLGFDEHWISMRLETAISLSLFPAALLTVLTSYFIIIRHPGNQLISLAVFFLSLFLLFSGTAFITQLTGENARTSLISPVPEKEILNYRDDVLYITDKSSDSVTGILHLSKNSQYPKMRMYNSGLILDETGMLQLEDDTVILQPANPTVSSVLHMPVFLLNVIRDIEIAKGIIFSSSSLLLLSCIFFCSLWIFSRISSWPLFNLIVTAAALRGILFLCYLSTTPFVQRVLETRNISTEYLVTAVLAATAVLLFIWDIFFIPYTTHSAKKA